MFDDAPLFSGELGEFEEEGELCGRAVVEQGRGDFERHYQLALPMADGGVMKIGHGVSVKRM